MRKAANRISPKLALSVVTAVLICFAISQPALAESLSQWSATSSYPSKIAYQSCVVSGAYIYCVGGVTKGAPSPSATNAVYYASLLSSGGVASWSNTTSYPAEVSYQSCVATQGRIYCVGGSDGSTETNAVYYASALSTGALSAWSNASSYPTKIDGQSCVVATGYIYCVGGLPSAGVGIVFGRNSTYYSAILPSGGLSPWSSTSSYPSPISGETCALSGGDLYCVGGAFTRQVAYTSFSSSGGLSPWSTTTLAPEIVVDQPCVVFGTYIYCVGTTVGGLATKTVYYGSILAPGGIASWTNTTSYPLVIHNQSCVPYDGYVVCIGGFTVGGTTNAVYYANVILPKNGASTTSTQPASSEISSTAGPSGLSMSGETVAVAALLLGLGVATVAAVFTLRRRKAAVASN